MAFNLKSITNAVTHRPPRIILLGAEKVGKSTFAAGAENPIFIPIKREEGIDSLGVAKFPACETYDDVMECLTTLAEEEHDFKTGVLDSASALEPLINEAVCAASGVTNIGSAAGGYGKGYEEAFNKWLQMMDAIDYLRDERGMTFIIIGHVKIKKFDDPERESYDQYTMDVRDTIAAALYRWADFIGFANTSVAVEKEKSGFKEKKRGVLTDDGARFLYTKKTPAHPGGGRDVYGKLPDELPLDYQAFRDAVDELTKAQKPSKPKATAKAKE